MQKNVEAPVSAEAIIIGLSDYLRLANLLIAPGSAMPPEVRSSFLEALDAAIIVDTEHLPSDVVRIGSSLVMRDCATGEERACILGWPEHGGTTDCVSVLTPLGSVLIGAAENTVVALKEAGGRAKRLRIANVDNSGLLPRWRHENLI